MNKLSIALAGAVLLAASQPAWADFERNVLVEVGTSVTAPNFKQGQDLMADLIGAQQSNPRLIVLSPHIEDDYALTSYKAFFRNYGIEPAKVIVNRNASMIADPDFETAKAFYDAELARPAVAKVSVTAKMSDDFSTITANSETVFDADMDAKAYKLVYIIYKDGCDPVTVGGETMTMDRIPVYSSSSSGLSNSVPATVKAGVANKHSYDIAVTDPLLFDGTTIVAVLLNTATKTVENVSEPVEVGMPPIFKHNFPRTVVIEEGTGTWCGWCVRGIVGMKRMAEAYRQDGRLVQVAIHWATDPMTITTYSNFAHVMLGSAAPLAIVDRRVQCGVTFENFEKVYLQELERPSASRININTSTFEEDGELYLDLTAFTEFAFDIAKANYRIAISVVEDNVGPYDQLNYYSGGSEPMDGWEKKGHTVSTYFDDVLVASTAWDGQRRSLPTTIEAGEVYEFKRTLSLSNIDDPANCRVVAMVINGDTNEIDNACMANLGSSSVKVVEADPDAPVEYYNLQGIRVNADTALPGIYVRRQGTQVTKVRL